MTQPLRRGVHPEGIHPEGERGGEVKGIKALAFYNKTK